MTVTTITIALNPAVSVALLLFPAEEGRGRVPTVEFRRDGRTRSIHFSDAIDPALLGIAAGLVVLDPAATDDAIERSTTLEIRRENGGAIALRLCAGTYASDCRYGQDDLPAWLFQSSHRNRFAIVQTKVSSYTKV